MQWPGRPTDGAARRGARERRGEAAGGYAQGARGSPSGKARLSYAAERYTRWGSFQVGLAPRTRPRLPAQEFLFQKIFGFGGLGNSETVDPENQTMKFVSKLEHK